MEGAHLDPGQPIRIPVMEISRPTRASPSQLVTKISQKIAPHTFFKLLFAAASIIFLPVAVDPVKATLRDGIQFMGPYDRMGMRIGPNTAHSILALSTSGWADKAAPPIGPSAGTQLRTPGGKLYVEKPNPSGNPCQHF